MKKTKTLLLTATLFAMTAITACGSTDPFILAMGNSDVPVGQYTSKILTYFGLDESALAEKGLISYGTNVKEVTTQVSQASVSCGVIYATDAKSANLTVVGTATSEMCGQVIYPAAVLKEAPQKATAESFLSYLCTSEAMDVFTGIGFSDATGGEVVETAQTTETVTITVFAAASMTESITAIKGIYEAAHSNITLQCSFESSGTLKTQIQEGAECDVFISASPKQMNALDITCDTTSNPDQLDFIDHATRINLLENKVALAVPANNPAKINSFDDLKNRLMEELAK